MGAAKIEKTCFHVVSGSCDGCGKKYSVRVDPADGNQSAGYDAAGLVQFTWGEWAPKKWLFGGLWHTPKKGTTGAEFSRHLLACSQKCLIACMKGAGEEAAKSFKKKAKAKK